MRENDTKQSSSRNGKFSPMGWVIMVLLLANFFLLGVIAIDVAETERKSFSIAQQIDELRERVETSLKH